MDAPDPLYVHLGSDELLILNNALNEVCNGIEIVDVEFRARIGVERDEAKALLVRLRQLSDGYSRQAS